MKCKRTAITKFCLAYEKIHVSVFEVLYVLSKIRDGNIELKDKSRVLHESTFARVVTFARVYKNYCTKQKTNIKRKLTVLINNQPR